MATKRPTILNFAGLAPKDAIRKAKEEFRDRYEAGGILDPLDNEVVVPSGKWHHICFKSDDSDDDPKAPREVWRPDRAAHIPWIAAVLTAPWEIRPNKVKGRLSYFLQFPAEPGDGHPAEAMYFAVTEPTGEPKKVALVTAYPILRRSYWNDARKVGACLHPQEKAKATKAGRK